ncbi:MAG: hypothetical protein EHM12_11280 [Dehalococcoidia bacterium]|nr:MAG: hypothetical protein EHM12_11280 [Dehalococcoidia bacterium]
MNFIVRKTGQIVRLFSVHDVDDLNICIIVDKQELENIINENISLWGLFNCGVFVDYDGNLSINSKDKNMFLILDFFYLNKDDGVFFYTEYEKMIIRDFQDNYSIDLMVK